MNGKFSKQIFAKNLKRLMDENGKSRMDVCDALGFSYYTFSDWVNGKKFPRIDKIEKLEDYFGCDKSELLEEKMTEEKEKSSEYEGLSDSHIKLIEFAKTVPEDKVDMILRVMQSIVEGG